MKLEAFRFDSCWLSRMPSDQPELNWAEVSALPRALAFLPIPHVLSTWVTTWDLAVLPS